MGEHFSIEVNGDTVPVAVRRNRQARRLILRVNQTTGDVTLTLPTYVGAAAAEKFLTKQTSWIAQERAAISPASAIGEGEWLSLAGEMHQLVFTGSAPRTVQRLDGQLIVGGPKDLAPARLEKWLRQEAKNELLARATHHAETLDVSFSRVSIGDMKSRWGSCSSKGTLRFSWRLLMAPHEVLDYVAAHEVAHLLEMNHSERFWRHVARCVPEFQARRRWLKTEGNELFKIRF